MGLEAGRQTHFIDLVPNPAQVETPLLGKRTIIHALADDFQETTQRIRQIYLPQGSVLLVNNHLLEEAIETAKSMGSLDDDDIEINPSLNLALASNLETLRRRQLFLEEAKRKTTHPKIAHTPQTTEWENELRLSTDRQFIKIKTSSPEDKIKSVVPWTGATTEALWQMSLLFYPTSSADMADRIAGEDRLTSELFGYYIVFLKNKERLVEET